ncbi:MAG: 16S rRNA (adenine(1518)-N(6)/adenine(1519)-N(6))-dimethyltransferase RsmA [Chloroflexi bacterium]|nr:16S rRNA (adenine(1518)-N(6)/adenine(1519)-N(6))-dimethyltransferase RsmA [Chloroflexota bacterium]
MGQNFLVDEEVLSKIIQAADLRFRDSVVEVGPGLGVLTKELAKRASRVVAVELDRGLAAALAKTLIGFSNVEIITEDVLKFDPAQHVEDLRYKLVANLPYYITSPSLRHFLEADARPETMVVMVQKEVAQRMVAKPGAMSVLAVSVQYYGEPTLLFTVPAGAFYPPPKVDSAVVRIRVFERPAVDVPPEKFFRVVHAGFSQPRKQLHNALAQTIWLPPNAAVDILRGAGIDEKRRAQTLSLEDWARICREMEQRGHL